MAGATTFLDDYGVSDERRNRVIRWIILSVVAVAAISLAAYIFLEDYGESQKAKRFIEKVNAHDYKAAYEEWGCTAQHPCPNYDFSRFLDTWGPQSKATGAWKIASTDSCKSFLTVNVRASGAEPESLAVQRNDNSLGYAPAAECQERKWRFGQFFRQFFTDPPPPTRK